LLRQKIQLHKAPVIKFLSVLQPGKTPEIDITIEVKETPDHVYQVKSNFQAGEITFFKFKGNFHETK
jgi:hypothetical protein